jgi:hydrogenase expression/formation protein HypC
MCLGIPGEVVSLHDEHGLRFAKIRFGGILRDVCVEYVPEAVPGDYVLVHVGFAIARIDAAEAERTIMALLALGQASELAPDDPEQRR